MTTTRFADDDNDDSAFVRINGELKDDDNQL